MGQFQLKKSDLWLKFALFDSKTQNLQIRQWVASYEILPYLTQFLENFTLPYLEYPLYLNSQSATIKLIVVVVWVDVTPKR